MCKWIGGCDFSLRYIVDAELYVVTDVQSYLLLLFRIISIRHSVERIE